MTLNDVIFQISLFSLMFSAVSSFYIATKFFCNYHDLKEELYSLGKKEERRKFSGLLIARDMGLICCSYGFLAIFLFSEKANSAGVMDPLVNYFWEAASLLGAISFLDSYKVSYLQYKEQSDKKERPRI